MFFTSLVLALVSPLGCAESSTSPPEALGVESPDRLTLDAGGVTALLDALEKNALSDADVDALLRVDGVRAMVKNVIRFVPDRGVPEFRTEIKTFARTKEGGKDDAVFQLSGVWERRVRLRHLLAELQADQSRIVHETLALLAPYRPPVDPLAIHVYFVAGGVSDGFVFEDAPEAFHINLGRGSDDRREILSNVVHEAYHVLQIAAQKRSGTFAAWIADASLPPVQRLLAGTLLEGTAALVADPARLGSAARGGDAAGLYRRALRPKQIAQSFALFDTFLAQLREGKISWEEVSRRGFSHSTEDEERFYFVGYTMAKEIERSCGRQCIGALFQQPPVEFFRRYIALTRQHPEMRPRFSPETARSLAP